jgi:hypothetical protein
MKIRFTLLLSLKNANFQIFIVTLYFNTYLKVLDIKMFFLS